MLLTLKTQLDHLINWIVRHRVRILLCSCMTVSLGLCCYFWQLAIYPVSVTVGCVFLSYVWSIFIRRRYDELALTVSCLSIVLFATVAIVFLGTDTGFELYIFGVIASIFLLLPNSGGKRHWYQLISFLSLAAARGLANNPYLGSVAYYQSFFRPYIHNIWYINFVIASATAISVSFFFAQSEEKAFEELEGIARTDELTGLYNRHHAVPWLSELRGDFSLAILDIDDFKRVNDTFGHDVGDEVLKGISQCLVSSVRAEDEVSRWGGEEFLIVLPKCPLYAAERVIDTILTKVSALRFDGYPQLRVTISAGVTESKGRAWGEVLQEADGFLYYSKEHGKNVVTSSTVA